MHIDDLTNELKRTLGRADVEYLSDLFVSHQLPLKELIKLSLVKDIQVGFRASWMMECVFFNHNNYFKAGFKYFIDVYHQQNNLSCQRHYAKILAQAGKQKSNTEVYEIFSTYKVDELIEVNFSWLISDKTPVAVKSQCLDVLSFYAPIQSWVKLELLEVMSYLVDKESYAFFAKTKQIKPRLQKIK